MAFVAPTAPVTTTAFTGHSLRACAARKTQSPATVRCTMDSEPGVVGKQGSSMWKESWFTGGMPGGEAFYNAWVEDGMTKDFPDMPTSLQPASEYVPTAPKKAGLLGRLDATEFFKGFFSGADKANSGAGPEVGAGAGVGAVPGVATGVRVRAAAGAAAGAAAVPVVDVRTPEVAEEKGPDEALYAQYFPAARRNLAPEISIVYTGNPSTDSMCMAMTEVTASASDVYFPKEMKNKAPMIDIFYDGSSLSTASVSVKMAEVEGMPPLPPPVQPGETVVALVPGSGGGLKLDFTVQPE